MSDNNNPIGHDYLGTADNPKLRLSGDVLILMLKGAGYAAVFCLATWFSIWVLYAIGLQLPAESREAEDPTPFSFELRLEGDQIA